MIVTEGGGTPSLGAATAGAVFGGAALGLACGTTVSSAAQDATADNDAKTNIINANRRFARIWPPANRRISSACSPGKQHSASRRRLEPDGPRYQRGSAIKVRIFYASASYRLRKNVPAFNARERSTPESGRAYAELPATRHHRGDGPADRRLKNPVAVRAGSPH